MKEPAWGEFLEIPAPFYKDNAWTERPENQRRVGIWENFDIPGILDDFYGTMADPVLINE